MSYELDDMEAVIGELVNGTYLDDLEPQAEVVKTEVQATNVEPIAEDLILDL